MRTKLFVLLTLILLVVGYSTAARAGGTFNLADFGAVGDNVADDGPALQSALNALAAAGGGTLIVPQGRYAIVTPVSKDFTGLASSVSILGVPSNTVVVHSAPGNIKSLSLGLTSEFYPKTGEARDALTITGLNTLLIKDIGFVGTLNVDTDARNTLIMRRIGEATLRHCEFYALRTRVSGGSIITARESKLKLEQSKILGSTGPSGASVAVIENHLWKGVEVTDTVFGDYGQRPGLYGKMIIAPIAWVSLGSAAPVTSDSPRREVVIRRVFMDEGSLHGLLSRPLTSDSGRARVDLVYVHDHIENVGHFQTFGLKLTEVESLLVEKSRYKWSRNASAGVYTQQVGTAIIDRTEFVDHADRIAASSETDSLYVIDSLYGTLDSLAPTTRVITTTDISDDPVQYVRQQYESLLGREPDPAGHFYWSDLLLRCDGAAECLRVGRAKLDTYLNSAPAPNFSITGRVTDGNGQGLAGVAVNLGGGQPVTALTDSVGNYKFNGLPTSGAYTVTAVSSTHSFGPESWTITTPAGNQTAKDFVVGRQTFSVSGKVLMGTAAVANQQVRVTSTSPDFATRTVATQYDGSYVFEGIPAGHSYTVDLPPTSYIASYTPTSHSVTNLAADRTGLNFTVTPKTYEISGRVVLSSAGLNGIVVRLKNKAGAVIRSVTTATSGAGVEGSFKFDGVIAGRFYSIEPVVSTSYYYTPAVRTIKSLEGNESAQNFAARRQMFTISGQVLNSDGSGGIGDATLTLTSPAPAGFAPRKVTTGTDGSYTFTSVPGGRDYVLTPSKPDYTFKNSSAPSQSVRTYADLGADQTSQDFAATSPATLSISDRTVTEGDSGTVNATFTVTLAGSVMQPVSVAFAASGVTAAEGSDFNAASGTLNFTSASSQTITVQVKGDKLDEPNETFQVLLSNPTNATIADGTGVGTINDNDLRPELRVNSLTTTETNTATTVTFTVSLSAPSGQTVTVKYATANSTAVAPADYTASALTTLTFLPGQTSKSIPVQVKGDLLDEAQESFKLVLSTPTNAAVIVGTGTCTITDNDPAPSITITDRAVTELDSGAVNAVFTIKLSAPSGQPVTVKYATGGGTAAAGTDYTALALTTLTFAPGQTSRAVAVQVKGDLATEPNETFFLNLSGATNATIADSQGLGTILNND